MDVTSTDKVILVMGATGAGKSTLVNLITGDTDVKVGHDIQSETKAIRAYHYWELGTRYCLVDTPGFDDTYVLDTDILAQVTKWLVDTYRKSVKISVVLYIHSISQPRMQGSALRNYRVFQKLCGENYSKRIVLLTTFHDIYKSEPEIISSRLKELKKEEFFGSVLAEGAIMRKAPRTQEGGRSLMCDVTQLVPIALKVQEEVVDQNVAIQETVAMKTMLELELERQRSEFEQKMKEAKEDFARQMREMEEKRAEELRSLRKEFEESEAAEKQPRRAFSEQLDSEAKTKESDPKVPKPPRRAQTTSNFAFQKMLSERQKRWESFNNAVQSTLNVLMTGKRNGHVRCDLILPIKAHYSIVCRHCMRTIGQYDCFRCKDCADSKPFILCGQCYESDTVLCNDRGHVKSDMETGRHAGTMTQCPRANNPPQNRTVTCCKCKTNVGICYLHCCNCREAWDMCVNCAIKGKYCPGHGRTFPRTPHTLHICFRYLE